jgi:hypothetical protein
VWRARRKFATAKKRHITDLLVGALERVGLLQHGGAGAVDQRVVDLYVIVM